MGKKLRHQEMYVDGKPHRTDGPAEIHYFVNGKPCAKYWYLDGKQYKPYWRHHKLHH